MMTWDKDQTRVNDHIHDGAMNGSYPFSSVAAAGAAAAGRDLAGAALNPSRPLVR